MKVVSLVGLPGSGKSTVGKALEDIHGWFYVDSDEEVEKTTSRTAANIIREDGERAFRVIESEVIHQLVCNLVNKSGMTGAVISLGGGAVTIKENLDLLLSKTVVINLVVSLAEQVKRVSNDSDRPLIEGKTINEVEANLKILREQRSQFYAQAQYQVETDGKTAVQLAHEISDLVTKLS